VWLWSDERPAGSELSMKFSFWNRGNPLPSQGFRVQLENVAALLRKQASELPDDQERAKLLCELETVEARYRNDLKRLHQKR